MFQYEMLVLDRDGLVHCVTPRDRDLLDPAIEDYRLLAVAVQELDELILIAHIKCAGRSCCGCGWKCDMAK